MSHLGDSQSEPMAQEREFSTTDRARFIELINEVEEMRAHRIVCNALHGRRIGGDMCICVPREAYLRWLRGVAQHNPHIINEELKALGLVLAPLDGTQNE